MSLVIDAIRNRRSARAFLDRRVEREKIDALIEAFRWAPSSSNRQPWRLIVAESEAARAAWDAALTGSNPAWAPRAPLKLVVVGHPGEQPDAHGQQRFLLDCGLALENLLIQGCALGLHVRAMGGWDQARAKRGFAIPDPLQVVAFVAAGYPGRVEDLPEDMRKREADPRVRRPAGEIAFANRFGEPLASA